MNSNSFMEANNFFKNAAASIIDAAATVSDVTERVGRAASDETAYTFTALDSDDGVGGTGNLLGLDFRKSAAIRASLITLFGQPYYETPDAENAYLYVVRAVHKENGKTFLLTCYEGPSGPAIGGDSSIEGIRDAAEALAKRIKAAPFSDFHKTICYMDAPCKIEYGCKDGVPFSHETPLTYEDCKTEFPDLFS